jgi:hypothetical protein
MQVLLHRLDLNAKPCRIIWNICLQALLVDLQLQQTPRATRRLTQSSQPVFWESLERIDLFKPRSESQLAKMRSHTGQKVRLRLTTTAKIEDHHLNGHTTIQIEMEYFSFGIRVTVLARPALGLCVVLGAYTPLSSWTCKSDLESRKPI